MADLNNYGSKVPDFHDYSDHKKVFDKIFTSNDTNLIINDEDKINQLIIDINILSDYIKKIQI